MLDPSGHSNPQPEWDFEDFFENSLNGHLIAATDGRILHANSRLSGWLGVSPQELVGKRFSDLLTIGGRILFETHLFPLLHMQGFFSEVALELSCPEENRLPVFVNAQERRSNDGSRASLHLTLFKGRERKQYEEDLRLARNAAQGDLDHERRSSALREQFIAVLGHDLRNPLGAITMGSALLEESELEGPHAELVKMMRQSASRMSHLIDDVMDFARGRLGSGILVTRKHTLLEPVLAQVVDELRTGEGRGTIRTEFDLTVPIYCDANRLAQLLSNLVGNALTHGQRGGEVVVRGRVESAQFELSVSNSGNPIPHAAMERLFEPFTREEIRPSAQGLGLGLYIASQIARSHGGIIDVSSTIDETRFTLRMPVEE